MISEVFHCALSTPRVPGPTHSIMPKLQGRGCFFGVYLCGLPSVYRGQPLLCHPPLMICLHLGAQARTHHLSTDPDAQACSSLSTLLTGSLSSDSDICGPGCSGSRQRQTARGTYRGTCRHHPGPAADNPMKIHHIMHDHRAPINKWEVLRLTCEPRPCTADSMYAYKNYVFKLKSV